MVSICIVLIPQKKTHQQMYEHRNPASLPHPPQLVDRPDDILSLTYGVPSLVPTLDALPNLERKWAVDMQTMRLELSVVDRGWKL